MVEASVSTETTTATTGSGVFAKWGMEVEAKETTSTDIGSLGGGGISVIGSVDSFFGRETNGSGLRLTTMGRGLEANEDDGKTTLVGMTMAVLRKITLVSFFMNQSGFQYTTHWSFQHAVKNKH